VYRPAHFVEDRIEVIHDLIRRYPLATIVTQRDGVLDADHVPVLIDAQDGEFGTLRGHVARANPLWKSVAAGAEVLTIFQGRDHYVSPAWYAAKREHGKVVPTWNYMIAHARGPIVFHHERDWLEALVTRLTNTHEAKRAEPWSVSDAPADYIDAMLRAIVGFEIRLTSISGKWKMSQNRSTADRTGIAGALESELAQDAADRISLADAYRATTENST
jgi:transcriptional regulator